MKFYHLLIILYVGIIFSSFLILFFGNDGYFTFLELKDHREVLLSNIEELKKKNVELQQKIQMLKTNPQVIRILARKLGYYDPEENMIVLKGDFSFNNHYEVGNIVKNMRTRPDKDIFLRIIGFSLSLFIIVLIILVRQRKKYDH
ncbi:MAG: septum formation initiator family protein [Spirochaetales bacterium]|nr:septum formation initiator family protein [Spirochaetales bacterium]